MNAHARNDSDLGEDRIAVVIPAYNVERHIGEVIGRVPSSVERIIVVDDASSDKTLERAMAANDPRVLVLHHETNKGVGRAVMTGFDQAVREGYTILVKMDGDGQMDPGRIPDLIFPIAMGEADFVKGNRFADPATIGRMPWLRRAGNLALSFLAKMSTGCWQVFDPTNGFFASDASVYSALNKRMVHNRYFFEISLLFALNLERAVIQNTPMPSRYGDEISAMSLGRVLLEFPPLMLGQLFRRIWYQYFVVSFSIVSVFLVTGLCLCGFGGIWGLVSWGRSIHSGVPATTGTVMIAVLPLIIGVQLLIQSAVFDVTQLPTRPRSRLLRHRLRRSMNPRME